MIEELSLVVKGMNKVVYSLIQKSLNDFITKISKEKFACNYVPEVDIILKDQMKLYLSSNDEILTQTGNIQSKILKSLKYNNDGTTNPTQYKMTMPSV